MSPVSDPALPVSPENAAFLDDLFAQYQANPQSVAPAWQSYFAAVATGAPYPAAAPLAAPATSSDVRHIRLLELVEAYRKYGHLAASLNPLAGPPAPRPELDFRRFGFTEADLEAEFLVDGLFGLQRAKLSQVIALLSETYCRFIGVEFSHIDGAEMRGWLTARMESTRNRRALGKAEQLRMLERLTDAEAFEQFLQAKFLTEKRFSLEGAESLIPMMDRVIDSASALGTEDIVIGMAHRGRLNVLANVLGKPPADIFRGFLKFDEDGREMMGRGDVKYHLGYSSDYVTPAGRKVHLSLAFNPSHLEAIYPVLEGRVRARQDRMGDADRSRSLALVLHGDASFAGQGIISECLNFSELAGYTVGGTVHIIVNNQIGFTTNPDDGRSTLYASNIAKMLDIPILHVNGEDLESVAQAVDLAVEFRYRFKRDVVIDLYCYRKLGHNEADEPRWTQPVMYQAIDARQTVRLSYVANLVSAGIVTIDEARKIEAKRKDALEADLTAAKSGGVRKSHISGDLWTRYVGGREADTPDGHTGIALARAKELAAKLVDLPADFEPFPKMLSPKGAITQRRQMAKGERLMDWGFAENLCFASLLTDKFAVRLSGQDVARGTFSHRNAVYFDRRDGRPYSPLQHLSKDQAPFEVRNSPLSEYGVLGFDYGYSLDTPDTLVCWEAQFGDFANGAQIIIDQFISSAEDKWDRLSGLVMLLPHGFEGQGPEHSSARFERYLAMCAEDNMQVCNLTTPAQYFHVLRRQLTRKLRKPLIIMTPKALLRAEEAGSSFEDLTGDFQRVLGDSVAKADKVRRVLLCTGKVYYDLNKRRVEQKFEDTAILRLEQLYPLPVAQLQAELKKYPKAEKLVWVQEEPSNMGAWSFLKTREPELDLPLPLTCASRPESASPATGHYKAHLFEQEKVLDDAFQDLAPTKPRAVRKVP